VGITETRVGLIPDFSSSVETSIGLADVAGVTVGPAGAILGTCLQLEKKNKAVRRSKYRFTFMVFYSFWSYSFQWDVRQPVYRQEEALLFNRSSKYIDNPNKTC